MKQNKTDNHRGEVEVSWEECKGCGLCVTACPLNLLRLSSELNGRGYHPAEFLGGACSGCGVCFYACPEPGAITVYLLDSFVGARRGTVDAAQTVPA